MKRTIGMRTYEPTRRIRTHRHGWLVVAAALAGPGCVLEAAPDTESDLIEEADRVSQEFGPVVSCDDDETEPWPPQIPLLCFEACASDVSAEEGLQVACDLVQLTPVEGLGAAYETEVIPRCEDVPADDPENVPGVCVSVVAGNDLDPVCDNLGANLEFALQRDPSRTAPCGAMVVATCDATPLEPEGCGVAP